MRLARTSRLAHPAALLIAAAIAPFAAAAPLAFTPDPFGATGGARFVARTARGAILLSPGEIVLAPYRTDAGTALRVVFEGSAGDGSLEGADPLPGTVNYLIGSDPDRWRRDVPTFARVRYAGLYAGVDLVLEGSDGALKATYTVAPGGDPATIRWRYAGAGRVDVTAAGELAIAVGDHTLADAAPVAWQDAGGSRRPVDVAYAVDELGVASFTTGPYDSRLPLVIDPHLVYSTLIGGSDIDEGRDVAVDAAGNVVIAGTTRSPDLPGSGPPQASYGGPLGASSFGDAFVAKLNPAGDQLLFMTYLGGAGEDVADAIALDGDGSVYVTGMTRSPNFPTLNAVQAAPGAQECAAPPCSDAFVAKLNAAGNALAFSTYLGGAGNENGGLVDVGSRASALGIAFDSARNVVVTGTTESDDFPTPNGAFTSRAGQADAFVAKVRADGRALLYATLLGGTAAEYSGDVAVDGGGIATVTGGTLSSSFPVKDALQATRAGGVDVFVARLDTTATGAASLLSATYLGGSDADHGMALAVDFFGNVYVAGHTLSLDFPTPGGFQTANGRGTPRTPRDGFLAKLSPDAGTLLYGTYLGGSDADLAYAVRGNGFGQVFVAGHTFSDDFPLRDEWQSARGGTSADVFVVSLDPSQSGADSLLYATYLGGTASDVAYGVAAGAGDAAYVVGATSGATVDSFPIYTTLGPNGATTGVLVAKLDPRLQYWIPVASHVAGAKGSQWRTDLAVQNPGAAAADLSLRLVSGGTSYTDEVALPASGEQVLDDLAGQLAFTGSGAVEVLSSRPIRVSSRTYNVIAAASTCYPGGTFGQNYDLARPGGGLRAGESAWLTQLVETPSYRTNILVTNTGRRPATATVALYDGAGALLTSFQTTVPPGEMRLDSQPFLRRAGKGNLQRAYARVWVDAGYGVLASASVIDNLTNDPTTIDMIPAGGESSSVWIPVASHAAGAKGSQWRSDLGLLNPSTLAASVTLRFRSGGAVSTNTALVAPGSQAILADIIGAIPASGSGSLEVAADRGLLVSSRTYNLIASDATCFPKGTLGQSYPASHATDGLAAGSTAWLVGLRESAAYRTNISLTNLGATSASAKVTLYGGAGQTLGSYTVTLAAGEMRQENRPFLTRGGQSNLTAGYASVEVTSGSGVIALASVVDNLTNDPTTITPQS